MSIPAIIHQIWIQGATALPPRYVAAAATWRLTNPGWSHHVWDEESLRDLLAEGAPPWWRAYSKQPEIVARADVARYALLDLFGGLYADIDTECRRPITPLLARPQATLNVSVYSDPRPISERTTNSIIASVPGHPIWAQVLRAVEQNGPHMYVVSRTGPYMLRPILFRHLSEHPGDLRWLGFPAVMTTALLPRGLMRMLSRIHKGNCILDFNDGGREYFAMAKKQS